MMGLILLLLVLWALVALLIGPLVHAGRPWRQCLCGAAIAFVGILLPLFLFVGGAFLTPEWKGDCRHGWLDCFHTGKLALLPVVLWASAGLYALEVWRVRNPPRPWVVLGIFLGAVVSSACTVFGYIAIGLLGLAVPLYVAGWYVLRAVQLARSARLSPLAYAAALLAASPFWVLAHFWSRKVYLSLPNTPPECFVVTAAARGHAAVVGPFVTVRRGSGGRRVNRQLATLWAFEEAWKAQAPRSHHAFRRVYNRLGPSIAGRIRSPLAADLVHLALKPAEWLAAAALIAGERVRVPGRSVFLRRNSVMQSALLDKEV